MHGANTECQPIFHCSHSLSFRTVLTVVGLHIGSLSIQPSEELWGESEVERNEAGARTHKIPHGSPVYDGKDWSVPPGGQHCGCVATVLLRPRILPYWGVI